MVSQIKSWLRGAALCGCIGLMSVSEMIAQETTVGNNLFELVDRKIQYIVLGERADLASQMEKFDLGKILDHDGELPIYDNDLIIFVIKERSEIDSLRREYRELHVVFEDFENSTPKLVTYYDVSVTGEAGPRSMRVYFLNASLLKIEVSPECVSPFVYSSAIFEDSNAVFEHIKCQ